MKKIVDNNKVFHDVTKRIDDLSDEGLSFLRKRAQDDNDVFSRIEFSKGTKVIKKLPRYLDSILEMILKSQLLNFVTQKKKH